MLLAGASVDFNTILTSTTHIRALDTASTIYFSSRAKSVMSRAPGTRVGKNGSGLAATPTHLFALYCAGSLVLRDGARLELTAEEPNAGVSSQLEPARYDNLITWRKSNTCTSSSYHSVFICFSYVIPVL